MSPSSVSEPRLPPRAWLVVTLLWLTACSYYLTRNLFVTMHGSIEAAIPMSETQFGLLTSAFLWVYAVVNPLGGLLADRFNRSVVIIVSLIAWSSVTWLTAYATSYTELIVLRVLMGISQACYMPSSSALVTDYHRGPTRSLATGLHMTGLVAGSAIGGGAGWLAERHGWSYAFSLIGLPSLAYGILVAFLLRDAPPVGGGAHLPKTAAQQVRFGASMLSLCRSWSVMAIVAISALQNAVSWMIIGWMPTYMREHFSLGQGAAGFSATGYLAVMQTLSLLASGVWSDRWSRRSPRARLWVPAIGLSIAAPGFFLAGHFVFMGSTVVCLCLWGIAVGFMGSNVMPVLCLITDPRYRASAYGLMNAAGAVAGGLAIYGAGAMRDFKVDLSKGLAFAGACAAACAVLFLLVKLKLPDAVPVPVPSA